MLSDQHFREGRILHRWLELFRDNPVDHFPPSAVSDFISHCAKNILVDHQLNPEYFENVHGLLEGHVFPLIFPSFFLHYSHKHRNIDYVFRKKCEWFRKCPPTAFEADNRFFPEGRRRLIYSSAIARLQDVEYLLVPSDMLLCIYESVMIAYHQASHYATINSRDIGADTLFPILLHVVARGDLSCPHTTIALIKMFSTKEALSSELGYYLCVAEAAITFITNAQPEMFEGFLDESKMVEIREFCSRNRIDADAIMHHDPSQRPSNYQRYAEAQQFVEHIEIIEDMAATLGF
jgi:hypothetical protein